MDFYRHRLDDTIYRENRGTIEILKDDWTRIIPSEQDYDHMTPITEEEAARRLGEPLEVLRED